MSATHTDPSPAGASASASSGPADHDVVPTVCPDASTTNTRPPSPESLVVTKSPSRTTSPLDSTIAGSWNVTSTVDAGPDGPASDPITNGTTATSPTTRSSISGRRASGPVPG